MTVRHFPICWVVSAQKFELNLTLKSAMAVSAPREREKERERGEILSASVRMGSESKKGTRIEKWIRHAPLTPKAPSGMTYERRSINRKMVSAGHPCVPRMT